jgi:phosphoglycolate phosphatase-like HAD superfamily hydrolase
MLPRVVVDIDETLIHTSRRRHAVASQILGAEIPPEAVDAMSNQRLFEQYASPEQREREGELSRMYWDLLLCRDEMGLELLHLDEAVPYAAEALRSWEGHCEIVYLTGRPESMRDHTLAALEGFGYPVEGARLVMFELVDWESFLSGNRMALQEARERLFISILEEGPVARVVDDFPGYFRTYTKYGVPDRVGLLFSPRRTLQRFLDRGATRVFESWEPLVDDVPSG